MSKKSYLCIQRSQPSQQRRSEAPSPAQMEEMYAKFNAWREKFQQNIVDMGGKLSRGGKKLSRQKVRLTGPSWKPRK